MFYVCDKMLLLFGTLAIFLNSGGVNSSFFYVKLNILFLKMLNIIDDILIFFLPSIFALNRTVVLKKINENKK